MTRTIEQVRTAIDQAITEQERKMAKLGPDDKHHERNLGYLHGLEWARGVARGTYSG